MIKVSVPATSANLGGGFDCLGLAVDIYNEVYVRRNNVLKIETDQDIPTGSNNLVYRAFVAALEAAAPLIPVENRPELLAEYLADKNKPLGLYLKQVNRIPKTSGMGSSAACIVAGVLAANKFLDNALSRADVIKLCTRLDGHPDNVLPAIVGGVTAGVVLSDGSVEYVKAAPPKELSVNVYTPSFALETRASRKVLPETYSRKDVVYSLSRAVVTFAALREGDIKTLRAVVGDRLHEPYRAGLIPDFESVKNMNMEAGAVAVYLSGAGPSVAAFVTDKFKTDKMREKLGFLPNNWKMNECEIVRGGAKAEEID